MKRVEIFIDGRPLEAEEGRPVLQAAESAGIFIPHLCALAEVEGAGGRCRLCWVQVEGQERPCLSCQLAARPGLRLVTRTSSVDRLVARAFQLLLSCHHLDCVRCPANRRCQLQKIARERRLPLKQKSLRQMLPPGAPDESRPELGLDRGKCVLCARCVVVCNRVVKKGVIDLLGRGLAARVGAFDGRPLALAGCGDCTACADVCPTGAIYRRPLLSDEQSR